MTRIADFFKCHQLIAALTIFAAFLVASVAASYAGYMAGKFIVTHESVLLALVGLTVGLLTTGIMVTACFLFNRHIISTRCF